MYIILVYDILNDEQSSRIQRNVFKTCKQYLSHIQKSVFEGNISRTKLLELELSLKKYIRKDSDSVIVFVSRDEKWLDKKIWGKDDKSLDRFI